VPLVVPLILTVTPIKVSPVFLSVTVPEIFPVCAYESMLIVKANTVSAALLKEFSKSNLPLFDKGKAITTVLTTG